MNLEEARKRIPELAGLSDESAMNVIHEVYYPSMDKAQLAERLGYKAPPPPKPERSTARAVGDLATQFAGGAVSGVRMMSDVFGADNAVSGGLRSAEQALSALQSAAAKADQQEIARIMQEAEGKGWGEQIVSGLKAFGVAPGAVMAQALGTSLPTLATAAIPGVGPAAAATRLGMAGAIGGAQGAGNIKGVIYEEVKNKLATDPTLTPEQIEARAVDAQAYSGDNAGQIALGGGLGVLAGSTGMERAVAGLRNGVTQAAPGMLARVGMGALTEAVPEALQGGQEKFAGNTALVNEGFDVDPWSGVVAQGTMEAAAGGLMGGAFGVPTPRMAVNPGIDQPQQTPGDAIRETELVPEGGPMTRAANVATEAKAQSADAALRLGFSPLAGTPVIFADGSVALGSEAEQARREQLAMQANIEDEAAKRAPRTAGDTYNLLAEAKERGLDYTVALHPAGGGFLVVPRQWVTPQAQQEAAGQLMETIGRMRQADAAPVQRAPRTGTTAQELDLTTDPVTNYVNDLRQVNTPAAKLFVRDFDAGSLTADDVRQRMEAERTKTPDERLAAAAAEGLRMNPKGDPFKTMMAAQRAAKQTPGEVVEVQGGYAIRQPQESASDPIETTAGPTDAGSSSEVPPTGAAAQGALNVQDAPQPAAGTQAEAAPGEAPAAGGSDAAAASGVPAAGGDSGVRADGVKVNKQAGPESVRLVVRRDIVGDKFELQGKSGDGEWEKQTTFDTDADAKSALKSMGYDADSVETLVSDWNAKAKRFSPPKPDAGGAGDIQADGVAPAWADMTPDQRKRARLEQEIATGKTNNGGVIANLRPSAIEKRKQELAQMGDAGRLSDLSKNPPKIDTSAEPAQAAAGNELVKKPTEPAKTEPFDHAGLKIRQTRTKVGNEVVDGWLVQSPENAEREARGELQIGGDRIVETREQAVKTAEQEVKRSKDERARKDALDREDAERKAVTEARKEANRGKTLLERRAEAILDKQIRESSTGDVITRREWVERRVKEGLEPKVTQEDKIKPMSRMQAFRADNRQQAEHDKKVKEAGKKDVYWLGDFEITKTEYDYVQKVKANPPAESKPKPEATPETAPTTAEAENTSGWSEVENGFTSRPVYRYVPDPRIHWATVQNPSNGVYVVEYRIGDKVVSTEELADRLLAVKFHVVAKVKELDAKQASHQDPGEKPEAATKGVVNESLKTAAKNEGTKPSEMRKWLLAEIDKELLNAPDRADFDDAVKRVGEKDAISMYTGSGLLGKNAETGFITFDVPGDGKFKVRNSVRGLLEFRKNISASQGFKDAGQRTVGPEQNDGAQSGSGGKMAAINNMIDEGDFEAASDYAEAVEINLDDVKVPRGERKVQWDAFRKDGTLPPPVDTRPLPPQRTPAQIEEEKRQEQEAEEKRPKDTGWNMTGTGYAGKRYIGRNITLDDGRQVVARVYENAGVYEEAEVKVDGARKFTVTDRNDAQGKADAFIKTLTEQEAELDLKGFTRTPKGNGAFELRDGNLIVSVEPTGRDKFQARFGSAKSSPHLQGEQGAVDWADNYRKDGKDDKPKKPAKVTPQISGNPEKFIKVAADSVRELRRQDVDRVLSETPVQFQMEVARHIKDSRKDLVDEVDEVMAEMRSGSAKPVRAQIPEGYKPAGEPFYRDGDLIQGYAPFDLGQRVTMKESGGQSGAIDLFISPDKNGVFDGAMVKFDNGVEQIVKLNKLEAEAEPVAAAGTRRDPAKVSMSNPYEDGDIVTIDGQDWTVKQDTPGWYLTNTGNWRGTHPTIRNVKAMADLIRAVEQAAVAQPKAAEPEQETPRLTLSEATDLMEWQSLGTKDGVTKHILTFYESKADADAKTGRMTVAAVTKGERSATAWMVDGDDKTFGPLSLAKKRGMEIGMAKAVSDGFVDATKPAAPAQQEAQKAGDDRAKPEPVAPIAAKVDDFGEKLPPARRAMAAKLSEELTDDAIASQPLSKVWPLEENAAIEDKSAAAVAHVFRDAIPAKPRTAYKVKTWVSRVKMLRDFAASVLSGRLTRDKLMSELEKVYSLRGIGAKIRLLEGVDREQWKRIGDVSEAPDAIRYVDGKAVPEPSASVSIDGKTHWLKGSGNLADHMDAINAMLTGDAPESRMQFEVRQEQRGARKVFINKKGDKEYRRLMEFDTAEEARKAIEDQYADLVAAWEGVKSRDNITERDLRTAENRPRTGKDHRKGRDISAEEFQQAFGFRGGEFGKWVSQGSGAQERQFMLNSAYDALMDLSDIIGVPSKAISLDGTLGVAFGSRGGGWASAHFEPANLVINLTKPRGAGALAHEWFHALDNYFARKRGGEAPIGRSLDAQNEYRRNNFITHKTRPMMVRKDGSGSPVTRERMAEWRKSNPLSGYLAEDKWMEDPNHKLGVRAEVEERFNDLVQVLDASPMLKRSRRLEGSKTGDGYWSRTLERAARSFENYIQVRMNEQGYHNDFLVNVKTAPDVQKNIDRYPYLLPSEIAPVADAFSNLFNTIKTKEEDGKTVMFSIADDARAAHGRISRDGVTSPDDLRDMLRVPGYSQWAKSAIMRDVGATKALRTELEKEYPGFDWKGPKLNDQGVITLYPDWAGASVDSIKRLTAIADRYDVPIAVRGGSTENPKPALFRVAGFVRYNGLTERNDRLPETMFSLIRPAGGITDTTPLFSPVDGQGKQADTADHGTATQAHRDAAARFSSAFGGRLAGGPDPDLLDAVAPRESTKRGRSLASVAAVAERLFNREVVFVRFKGEPKFNGAVSKSAPGFIFLNIDSQKPLMAVLGHELLHEMAKSQPSMYANLSRRLDGLIKGETEYGKRLVDQYKKQGISLKGLDAREELEADIVGDNFMDPEFWNALAKNQPGLFRRIVNFITKWLDTQVEKLAGYRPFGTDEFLTDMAAAREAVADAMRQFSGAEVGAVADPADGDVKFSAAKQDREDIQFSVAGVQQTLMDAVPQGVIERLSDMTTSQRGFNRWWHRTVGTQLHKAKTNKQFAPVYYAVQDFMKDVSRMATLAADQAPDLLPQVDSLGDVKKLLPQMGIAGNRQRKAELKEASEALFDGTLRYTRDEDGQAVLAKDDDAKGLIWTTAELKARGMSDASIKMYRQARKAINQSLDSLLAADVYRMITAAKPEALAETKPDYDALMDRVRKAAASANPGAAVSEVSKALTAQSNIVKARIESLKAGANGRLDAAVASELQRQSEAFNGIETLIERVDDKVERIADLKASGYAPLMRFGQYTLDALDANGNRVFFGMYESQMAANQAARKFKADGLTVRQGIQSQKEFELLKGVSPETAMLFAEMMGMEKNDAMQAWLQNAVAEQSALKRHIRRKGVEGFENDASRVVAAFLTSNSRAASRALHGMRIHERVENVRDGDVKDEAIALAEYVNNPKEEAQALRSLLFINYIGGSVASALVNLTQTVVQTFPYLSQYGGPLKAGKRLGSAMKMAMGKIDNAELAAAVKRAEDDGVIKPQEVFQLQAEASRTMGSDLRVRAGLAVWGSFFQMAEVFNRRVAFVAAYQTAKEQGIKDPFAFAENAVDETQGVFNKGNRPDWSRGAVGATLFTFKTFTIQYVEFLKRLPPKEKALALGVLILLSGIRGLPFAADAEDLIDTVAQQLGYNFTTKDQMDRFLVATLGSGFADFLQHGSSTIPGVPFDVSARLGMADLLPGTGLLKPSETRKEKQVLDVFGVAGGFVRDALKGEFRPIAIRNLAKGLEMYDREIYTDTRGRKVMDVGGVDALMKGIGLQPNKVAAESRAVSSQYEKRALFTKVKGDISEQLALGMFEQNQDKVKAARQKLDDWNEKNPEARIVINSQAIRRRVVEMRRDRADRFVRSAPKELKAATREAVE